MQSTVSAKQTSEDANICMQPSVQDQTSCIHVQFQLISRFFGIFDLGFMLFQAFPSNRFVILIRGIPLDSVVCSLMVIVVVPDNVL